MHDKSTKLWIGLTNINFRKEITVEKQVGKKGMVAFLLSV